MNILSILMVVFLAGSASGVAYGVLNLILVKPYIDMAIELEAKREGVAVDLAYRSWQLQGSILAAVIAGITYSLLYTIVYIVTKSMSKGIKRSMLLALTIWSLIYLIPVLKYPANPPAVGDPETIYFRQIIFVTYMLISGVSAFSLYILGIRVGKSSRLRSTIITVSSYAVVMVLAYMLMPSNMDSIDISEDILLGFRFTSAITSLALWLMIGVSTSLLWKKSGLVKSMSMD
jgi:hypothetical protein